jgi:hypothetical protein
MRRQQRVKDPRAIQVMNALGVAFPVTRPANSRTNASRSASDMASTSAAAGCCLPAAGGIRPGAQTALLEGLQQAIGQVLGPVDLRVFGHHLLVPDRAGGQIGFRP